MTREKAMRAMLLALFSFLAACGGGAGGGASPVGDTPAPTPTPSASAPAPSADETSGPNWSLARVSAAAAGTNASAVDAVLDHVFSDAAVQSAMLVKDGYIVGERYADGIDASTLGTSWSVAKSYYSAAVGIAIDEGWISSLDQPASDFFTEWEGTNKSDITVRDLLEMRSGLPASSNIFLSADQTAFALSLTKTRPEGGTFVYSNPTSQLFEPLLLRSTGLDAHSYLRQKVLTPIGVDVEQIGMWRDSVGNPVTYFGLDLRPEDMARFGLLYARGGEWDGTQVISESYVTASTSEQSLFYGFQWWLMNEAYFGASVPIQVSAALGLDGQKIYVWAEQDVVLVVFTHYDHSANAGYTLSLTNFPSTCAGRNTCNEADSPVTSFSQYNLMFLLQDLVD